jgi:hypothetical protein
MSLRNGCIAVLLLTALPAQAQVRITEYMYSGEEFIELSNLGANPVDFTGWSFDDNSRVPGSLPLTGFGTVAAGESVIISERGADTFREVYGLCAGLKVIGGNSAHALGRADEINLYDAQGQLVDRLTYDDATLGGPRTQNASAWVSAAGVGSNSPTAWTLSAPGDAEASALSSNGYPASPGRSSLASPAFNPCAGPQRADLRITEFAYSGIEFVEFANTGEQTIDLTGWSFDDSSNLPGSFSLSAFGSVAAGETVIVSELPAAEFRSRFGLCEAQKVIGDNSQNLGRSDAINLYDASGLRVDQLVYNDQAFPGSPRTDTASAWATAAGLGNNDPVAWTLSSAGDQEGSRSASTPAGFFASPGGSTRTRVLFEACPQAGSRLRLTEYMYQGANGEFMEFSNVGDAPADLSGWSFHDSGRVPGSFDLSAAGVLQPGESVVVTESVAETFREAWNLCAGQKLIGGSQPGIGRADEINLYDAFDRRVDRLTYDDQTLGGPRTQAIAAWPQPNALGANLHMGWMLAMPNDPEGSYASTGGDIGSPGRSTRVAISFDPCVPQPGLPTIVLALETTSPFLQLGTNGGSVSGVIDDPSDPAASTGIGLLIGDALTAPEQLTVTVSSSNPAVVPPEGLSLSGSGAIRQLRISPIGVGYSTLRVTVVNAAAGQAQYLISYAASAAAAAPATTVFHTGASDASTALTIGSQLMLVADDENQNLRLYDRSASGLPLGGFDFTGSLGLDGGANPDEVDIEASTRVGDRLYWLGSLGNNRSGALRPNRNRVFATQLTLPAGQPELSFVDRYDFLRQDLIAWDAANGHGLGADALNFTAATAAGVEADTAAGFNVEGLSMAPDGSTAWLAFRAPLRPRGAATPALLVPVLNFDSLVVDGQPGSRPQGAASFGAPIFLDLGGRSIRSIERGSDGVYLIVAGPADYATEIAPSDFRLFVWSGDPNAAPALLPVQLSALNASGSFEAIVAADPDLAEQGGSVQLLVDNGDAVYYADGTIAKELSERRFAKFRSLLVQVPGPAIFGNGFEVEVR